MPKPQALSEGIDVSPGEPTKCRPPLGLEIVSLPATRKMCFGFSCVVMKVNRAPFFNCEPKSNSY
jgi:hypothetical protein